VTEREAAPAAASERASHNLLARILASLVLAPVTIGAAYAGDWLWTALVTLAAIGLYLEWLMIVGAARAIRITVSGSVALVVAGSYLAAGAIDLALAAQLLGLVVVALLSSEQRGWAAAGFLYAAAAQMAAILVRLDPVAGFAALIFVLLVVWVTDIGGYFAGRGLGGPKLWPRVSPKKTWAGALGGLLAAVAVAIVVAKLASLTAWFALATLAVVLSLFAQAGDLFESFLKRRFDAKDSSRLIPGHGGLMDRLDGFVTASLAAVLIGLARGGLEAPGRGLLLW